MQTIKNEITKDVQSGRVKIVNDKMPDSGLITPNTEPITLKKNEPGGTAETLPELSGACVKNLERESLDSMSLLNKSANKLMRLMDECVKEDDLEQSREGIKRVEGHKIESAISCANAIAMTIQTQVNLVKSLSGYIRK